MGKCIAVTSGKGGTGKSTISSGLAINFAKCGKKVLLVDLDIGLRCLDIFFGIEDSIVFDLSDVLNSGNFANALYKANCFDNIYIAPAPASDKELNPERFADYGEESRLRARDLKEIQALVIESCRLEAPEAELARFKNLESLTLRQVELESFSLLGQANLKDLTIEDTPITALDLSDALSLQRLVLERTALTELDFSAHRALKVLSYGGTKLGWLDFTDLPVLQYLDCSDSGITETEITGETLPNLITLRVADNPEVTSVALATFPNLAQLDCASCSIETITLADFPHLYYLRCSYNKITELDFSELRQVYAVECFGETLQKLVVTNWAEYAYADCEITRLRV